MGKGTYRKFEREETRKSKREAKERKRTRRKIRRQHKAAGSEEPATKEVL